MLHRKETSRNENILASISTIPEGPEENRGSKAEERPVRIKNLLYLRLLSMDVPSAADSDLQDTRTKVDNRGQRCSLVNRLKRSRPYPQTSPD